MDFDHDGDLDVACAAIGAIADIGPDGSEPALQFALESAEPRMVRAAFASTP